MSVVNKMLRDLDNRDYAKNLSTKSVNYVPPKSSKVLWVVIGCLSFFCVAAASFSVYVVNQSPATAPVHQVPEGVDFEKGDQHAQLNNTHNLDRVPSALIETSKQAPNVQKNTQASNVAVALTPKRDPHFSVAPSSGSQGQLSRLRAKAHMASEKNNDAEVTRLLKEILFIAPLETKTRKQLAALLFSTNKLSDAQQVLAQGIKQTPSDSSMRLMQSRIFFKLGDNSSAFTVLSEHPYSALANDELVSFRAALAEKIGQYGNAQKDYQILVQRNPKDAKWWLGLGVSQDKQKLNEQAVSSYQQAQSLNQLPLKVDLFLAERIELLTRRS
jgi:MSHA biogenesis protein MshN